MGRRLLGRRQSAQEWTVAAVGGLAAYLLAQPLLGLSREFVIGALALCLHALVASKWWQAAVHALGLDPIYAGAAIRSLGTVDPNGVAVAAPVGAMLHTLVPRLFAAPGDVVPGAFASLVVGPGASVLGHALVTFCADMLVLLCGLACTVFSRGRRWLLTFGLLVQAHIVVAHLLTLHVGASDLEATGLPFAIALVVPSVGWWLTEQLGRVPPVWQSTLIGIALIAVAYAIALPVLLSKRLPSRRVLAAGSVVAMAMMFSPVGGWARASTRWQATTVETAAAPIVPAPAVAPELRPAQLGPHAVTLGRDSAGNWDYLVNGTPEVIRGIGYNAQYADLPRSERASLYQRDFGEIRSIGANTIEGWYDDQFDELTLEYAARNGLGVILPYRLRHDWDYADPVVQARILQDVSTWVMRYRDNPALRMWAPGNENLHRMLYSKWTSQEQLPQARTQAQAFAAFLPRLIDRIHELDPSHPVVYRDAEDAYLDWLAQGFSQTPASRPWFVYGANVYSRSRLTEIIDAWPRQSLGGPLLISEFAPINQEPDARAFGYVEDWQRIRAHPEFVLGGLAYAWAANGPEQLDRVFGLVDPAGTPRDAAVAELASVYRRDGTPAIRSATGG